MENNIRNESNMQLNFSCNKIVPLYYRVPLQICYKNGIIDFNLEQITYDSLSFTTTTNFLQALKHPSYGWKRWRQTNEMLN